MKIRNGFVSNSSSSSYIIMCSKKKKIDGEHVRTLLRTIPPWDCAKSEETRLAEVDSKDALVLRDRVHERGYIKSEEDYNAFCEKLFSIKKDNFLGVLELSYHDDGYRALISILKKHGLKVFCVDSDDGTELEKFLGGGKRNV